MGCATVGRIVEGSRGPAAAATTEEQPSAGAAEIQPASATLSADELTQGQILDELQARLAAIYERVNPSVVSIQVGQKIEIPSGDNPFLPYIDPDSSEMPYQQGSGSGFVWDKEGHIITNNHVVAGADKITVQFADGSMVPAELVGADPDSDLAVIKVNLPPDRLTPVKIGDSTQVKVGQLVVAIGNPFGLGNTMTVGFVSALERSLPVNSERGTGGNFTIPNIIQTDAPINPGNSGGVLLNAEGEVIGVPSAIISSVSSSAGIGFAIPTEIVAKVVPALIEGGSYDHAWVGIQGTTLTPDMAEAMGLDAAQRGALVITVIAGGPAEAARLRGSERIVTIDGVQTPVGGDVIIGFDDTPITKFEDLVAAIGQVLPGTEVTLTILRDGETETVPITLDARPATLPE